MSSLPLVLLALQLNKRWKTDLSNLKFIVAELELQFTLV